MAGTPWAGSYIFFHGLLCTGSRVNTSVFLKRKNEYVRSTKGSLSITSLWGGKKEENPDEAAKKVHHLLSLSSHLLFCRLDVEN